MGLTTFHTLFVIDLASRRVEIVGTTRTPNEQFVLQAGRALLDVADGFLREHTALIMDRDAKFSQAFRALLRSGGVTPVRPPARSPNCNAYAERFVRSIKEECLGRMIFFGEASHRSALREYVAHYNAERPHQGVGNRVLDMRRGPRSTLLKAVTREQRLGGLLSHYRPSAA
ncbi:MAG: integrase core domain-containing protein [Planctomycetota bacterium]